MAAAAAPAPCRQRPGVESGRGAPAARADPSAALECGSTTDAVASGLAPSVTALDAAAATAAAASAAGEFHAAAAAAAGPGAAGRDATPAVAAEAHASASCEARTFVSWPAWLQNLLVASLIRLLH